MKRISFPPPPSLKLFYDKHGILAPAYDIAGNRSHENALQRTESPASHDDEVAPFIFSNAENDRSGRTNFNKLFHAPHLQEP